MIDPEVNGNAAVLVADTERLVPGEQLSGEVRIGPLMALPQLLREMQVTPDLALQQAGVSPHLFDHAENRIRNGAVGRLLSVCSELTGRSDFGLMLGARFALGNLGTLGSLMLNTATVGEALRTLILHLHFFDRGAVPVLLKVGSTNVFLGYSLQHAPGSGVVQVADVAIAIAHRMLRELCGPGWHPEAVQFSHGRPRDIESYRRIFGPGVRFDCQLSGLSFSATWLAQAIAGADPARCERLTRVLQRAQSRGPLGFTEEVQCVLHQLLPGGAVSAEGVARWFGISERTLRHRLQGENTRLQQLLAETRFEVARNLLRNTRLPMSQIAAALCYTDAAVFSRAFHGWAGVSPRQWRAALA